jgi:alpha-D-ribose 1-methylphosphonate 5-triphosphate synthase subunit PhnH
VLDPRFDQVREAQRVFRLVLDATAWPGKVHALPRTTRVRGTEAAWAT